MPDKPNLSLLTTAASYDIMPEYSEEMARKATHRHEQRTPEERVTLLRDLLCSAASDEAPIYTGEDEDGNPFRGEPVNAWALSTLCYFLASGFCGPKITRLVAHRLVDSAYSLAEEHEAARRRYHGATADTCDECGQRHYPDDEECSGMDA